MSPVPVAARALPTAGTIGAVRLFGVPVRFHLSFVLFLGILALSVVEGGAGMWRDFVFIVALFVSVLIHELTHALVARRYGVRTLEIVMYPIGGVARLDRRPRTRDELWIALAGPLINLFLAAGLLSWLTWVGQRAELSATWSIDRFLARLALGNLALGLFNLVPAFPMDGGRILRSLLARRYGDLRATLVASRVGRVLAVAMGAYGLVSFNLILMFIAFFVYLSALQEARAHTGQALLTGVPVKAAMVSEFHTLAPGDTLADASAISVRTTQQDFPVVLGDQLLGLLDRVALLRGLAEHGADAYVAGCMDRQPLVFDSSMDLGQAVEQMVGHQPRACALVVEGQRLVGMLTRESVAEFVTLARLGALRRAF